MSFGLKEAIEKRGCTTVECKDCPFNLLGAKEDGCVYFAGHRAYEFAEMMCYILGEKEIAQEMTKLLYGEDAEKLDARYGIVPLQHIPRLLQILERIRKDFVPRIMDEGFVTKEVMEHELLNHWPFDDFQPIRDQKEPRKYRLKSEIIYLEECLLFFRNFLEKEPGLNVFHEHTNSPKYYNELN